MIHQSDPTACFSIEFWDSDMIQFGTFPRVTLRLKNEGCAKKIIEKWSENFEHNIEKICELFDKEFVRRWRLFLYSSTAGFKYGKFRLFQVLFSNRLNNALPIFRAHIYQANRNNKA